MEKFLRHIVLFSFKDGISQAERNELRRRFEALPGRIPLIRGFERGVNNSPEGLAQGFEEAYLLSFGSEEDRDAYLPHPAHLEFSDFAGPLLKDVLVFDYRA